MKKRILLWVILLCIGTHVGAQVMGYADSVNAGIITEDHMKGSPVRMAMADIGKVHVHITYGSPGVKGREIWGGLVSYDKVWFAGAHNATWISFSAPVKVNGQSLKAGKYGFFIIPKASGTWTIIFNSDAEMHLAEQYTPEKDVLRLEVKPLDVAQSLPRLTYEVKEAGKNNGYILFAWEKKQVRLNVEKL